MQKNRTVNEIKTIKINEIKEIKYQPMVGFINKSLSENKDIKYQLQTLFLSPKDQQE